MTKKLITLSNGLRVIVIEDETAESVALSLVGKAGSMYEKDDQAGVAHFLEHVVLDASRDYPDELSLNRIIEDVGGKRGGKTGKETVEYWAKVLPQHIENACIYLSQVSLHPLLKEKDIVKHKGIIEQEYQRIRANPESYVPHLIFGILFPHQPISKITTGESEDIIKITKDSLETFLSDTYTAQNFILVVCGKCKEGDVKDLAEKYFAEMKSFKTSDVKPEPHYQKEIITEKRPGIAQTALEISYHGYTQDDPKSSAAEFIAAILSRGKLSRLTKRIRDELGLAYVINAQAVSGISYGLFNIYSGLAEVTIPTYLAAIGDECEKLIDYDIPEDEWKRVLISLEAQFLFNFENPSAMANYYARKHLNRTELHDHDEMVKAYRNLTQENIRNTARELFSQEPKIVAVGAHVHKELFQ